MDTERMENLARSIAARVLESLRGGRPLVRILRARDSEAESIVRTVRERLEPGTGLGPATGAVAGTDAGAVRDAEFVFHGEASRASGHCLFILPVLSCSDLADLALGRASSPCLEEALRLLLSGAKLRTLGFEYKKYADSAPAALYSLYQSYEKTLAACGLSELKARCPEILRFREELVTEKDVLRAREAGAATLLIPATARVTPLAADAAGEFRINILKQL